MQIFFFLNQQLNSKMQTYAVKMRNDLWSNLKGVYETVSYGKDNISTVQVESVVKNIMKETDQMELDYIFKNLFRLDSDGSGDVSFNEFANFFLKRHCGQIALQRAHKKGLIGKGSERKLNVVQFLTLLSEAYSFLNVKTDEAAATDIFKQFDSDKDNLITYVEYFSFIDKFICKSKDVLKAEAQNTPLPVVDVKPAIVIPQGRIYRSRIRNFLWQTLRLLYNSFDFNRDGVLQLQEANTLICDILKLTSKKDIDYILFEKFNLGVNGSVTYADFYIYFIEHVGNLGLSQLVSRNPGMRRVLNRDQFVQLFRSSFSFLSVSRIQDELLWGFFNKIDTTRSGFITFEQYIAWLLDFLSPSNYRGDTYYFELDDLDLSFGNRMILDEQVAISKPIIKNNNDLSLVVVRREAANVLRILKLSKYRFSNLEIAKKIRANIFTLLSTYDRNRNKLFEEDEIIDLLRSLINESDIQIPYVIRNVFRYDRNDDEKVTYAEMANFLLEVHCGEMAIQRLHLQNVYKLGARRMMDVQEFVVTLTDALKYLRATASDHQLRTLFSEIDLDRDGLITYKEYFEFLKLYFGSESLASVEDIVVSTPRLTWEEEFAKWILNQSSLAFRGRLQQSMRVDPNFFKLILKQIFGELDPEIEFSIQNLFGLLFDSNSLIDEELIRKFFLLLHVGIIILLRGHNAKKFLRWSDKLLNQRQFVDLVLEATLWASLPFDAEILSHIFAKLDTDRDGFITYLQYFQFLISAFGLPYNSNLLNFFNSIFNAVPKPVVQPVQAITSNSLQQAEDLYDKIWNELRECFNAYLKNGATTLGKDDIKLLIGDILKEQNQQQLDYVFWNYFRLDKDGNNAVEFQQFAPFILNHATQIALQRFHSQQSKGKSVLSVQEFVLLTSMAFRFLRTIPKEQPTLRIIYASLDTDKSGELSYKQYLMWAKTLVNRYK